MPEEKQDAKPEESSPLEGAIASSPEAVSEAQEKVTETPTPQEGVTPEPVKEEQGETPLHEHPRFKEVVDEKNWYKQQLEQQMARQQQPQAPPQDPFAGMTPEEKVFWQNVDARAETKAKQILQTQVNPQLQAGIQEVARLRVEQFRRDHPDIKADSVEETAIAEKIRTGYLPEDAYRAVMWDTKVGEKRESSQAEQQKRLAEKRQANVVSSQSVSQQAVTPTKEKFDDAVARKIRALPPGTEIEF